MEKLYIKKLFVEMEYIVGSNINSRWKRVRYYMNQDVIVDGEIVHEKSFVQMEYI